MALLFGRVDSDTTQLVGRWKSDAMFRYLQGQTLPVLNQMARTMARHGHFDLVPGEYFPAATDKLLNHQQGQRHTQPQQIPALKQPVPSQTIPHPKAAPSQADQPHRLGPPADCWNEHTASSKCGNGKNLKRHATSTAGAPNPLDSTTSTHRQKLRPQPSEPSDLCSRAPSKSTNQQKLCKPHQQW